MARTMRAVVITRAGAPDVLEIRDVPLPEPRVSEVRVRVRAVGINRADLLQRRGLYPAPPDAPRDIPGLEYAGEIDALGDGTTGIRTGDRVMGIIGGGSYAEYLTARADHLLHVPDHFSYEDAAAIPEAFMTAHDALEQLDVQPGEWVLVHAIGSGVGTAALQLIRAIGAHCIGTSRTPEKLERALALGMDAGINAGNEELVPAVKRLTGVGVNAVVDLVGGAGFAETLKAMAMRGRVIVVGLTAGARSELDLGLVLRNRLRIAGTVLRSRGNDEKSQLVRSFNAKVMPLLESARATAVVDRVFALDEIRDAHLLMESNENFGKIVVRVQ